jgi:hypothetical protein
MFRTLAPLALALVWAMPARAQGPRFAEFVTLPPAVVPGDPPPIRGVPDSLTGPPDELGMGLGGLLAGFTGAVVGAYAGAAIDRANGCDEWCGLVGGLVGATAGTTIMVPVGVHLSNRQRGSLGRGVAWSAVVAAASWGSAMAFDDATPLLILPFAQIVASVAAEVATTPSDTQ